MQPVPITTDFWDVQHYVMKFASGLRQVGGFLRLLRFPPPRYNWNIVESVAKHHQAKYIITLVNLSAFQKRIFINTYRDDIYVIVIFRIWILDTKQRLLNAH
jgi:hypothetical protein